MGLSTTAKRTLYGPMQVSPLHLCVDVEDYRTQLWKHEMREYLRGFAGALFVALALLYTQEMWERAREIGPATMLAILAIAYVLNMGYISYSGFKVSRARTYVLWDAAIAMGLGMLASVITLVITARIDLGTPPEVILKLVALLTVPTSFGAALAVNQLGKREYNDRTEDDPAEFFFNEDLKKVTGTVLGGSLFAFNIMPTIEPKVMLLEVEPTHTLAILVFSLIISYGIEFMARFHNEKDNQRQGVLAERWLTTLFCYLVSLATSAVLLWMFGYLNPNTPPEMALPWVVIVGYAATLGGTAGRLIL